MTSALANLQSTRRRQEDVRRTDTHTAKVDLLFGKHQLGFTNVTHTANGTRVSTVHNQLEYLLVLRECVL